MKFSLKNILLLLVLTGLYGAELLAQTANSNVQVSVRIVSGLKVTQEQDLDLGVIAQGGTATVDVPTDCLDATPSRIAIFKIEDSLASQMATIDLSVPQYLSDGTNTIEFIMTGAIFCADTVSALVNVSTGSAPISMAADSNDNNKVYLGGSVRASSSQVENTYTGQIDLTIIY